MLCAPPECLITIEKFKLSFFVASVIFIHLHVDSSDLAHGWEVIVDQSRFLSVAGVSGDAETAGYPASAGAGEGAAAASGAAEAHYPDACSDARLFLALCPGELCLLNPHRLFACLEQVCLSCGDVSVQEQKVVTVGKLYCFSLVTLRKPSLYCFGIILSLQGQISRMGLIYHLFIFKVLKADFVPEINVINSLFV